MLVVAVGSVNNTFGIKGVKEHTLAFRGIRDATALRRQVSECFERAALPHTPPEVLPYRDESPLPSDLQIINADPWLWAHLGADLDSADGDDRSGRSC